MNTRYPLLIVGAIALSAAAGTPAATPFEQSPIVVAGSHATYAENEMAVRFSDLALSAPAGQKALVHRVSQAIDTLCDNMSSGVTDPVFSLKCRNDAWTRVQPQLALLIPKR